MDIKSFVCVREIATRQFFAVAFLLLINNWSVALFVRTKAFRFLEKWKVSSLCVIFNHIPEGLFTTRVHIGFILLTIH